MNFHRFTDFLSMMDAIVSRASDEVMLLDAGEDALKRLIAHDDWLPQEFAQASAEKYQQYVLYVDPKSRYSVQSFVWAPGQGTPVHNHTVWGLVGVMRGSEQCREFNAPSMVSAMKCTHEHALLRGAVDRVSPKIGDWHAVSNALSDQPSLSIHVYGGDIGRIKRSVIDATTGDVKPFVSGYSNASPWIATR
jgi:3-mercaptopropionate dioxygenase